MADEKKRIYVTHVNIRQSIFFLLLKLVSIELVAGTIIIIWHIGLAVYVNTVALLHLIVQIGLPVLIFLVFLKTFITIYLIMQWLNEYYEISASLIQHRRGIFFRRSEEYPIEDIKFVEVEQGLFGRMFNYGTISLMNVRRVEYAQMYLIHNPMRYASVIEEIVPNLVERKRLIRRHYHENGSDGEDEEI
ncbi:MAG TPA: PH domain-containing protein [Candidatus Acidoferrales bacterium]|nr:PH domain-containing protein [Candidatus Acidoferrales bacterium]